MGLGMERVGGGGSGVDLLVFRLVLRLRRAAEENEHESDEMAKKGEEKKSGGCATSETDAIRTRGVEGMRIDVQYVVCACRVREEGGICNRCNAREMGKESGAHFSEFLESDACPELWAVKKLCQAIPRVLIDPPVSHANLLTKVRVAREQSIPVPSAGLQVDMHSYIYIYLNPIHPNSA